MLSCIDVPTDTEENIALMSIVLTRVFAFLIIPQLNKKAFFHLVSCELIDKPLWFWKEMRFSYEY